MTSFSDALNEVHKRCVTSGKNPLSIVKTLEVSLKSLVRFCQICQI